MLLRVCGLGRGIGQDLGAEQKEQREQETVTVQAPISLNAQ
jgi:hypothetical protein